MITHNSVLIFGAGSVGRGFLGDLCTASGFLCWFVDTDYDLVSQLENARQYALKIVCGEISERVISPVRAIHAADTESIASIIETVDLIFTAAGGSALQHLAVPLASGLTRRMQANKSPINILVCENLPHAERVLKNHTEQLISEEYADSFSANTGFVRTVIGRMTPVVPNAQNNSDRLTIFTEDYAILPVDAETLVAPLPHITGIQPEQNFDSIIAQKLYLHNCAHAMLAYMGSLVQIDTIAEVVQISAIREIVVQAMTDVIAALSVEYLLKHEMLINYRDSLMTRFACSALGDTCKRVGRDPIRKLQPNDRLVGAARLVEKHGISCKALSFGIAAALQYLDPGDESSIELQKRIKDEGILDMLWDICGISSKEPLGLLVLESMKHLPLM